MREHSNCSVAVHESSGKSPDKAARRSHWRSNKHQHCSPPRRHSRVQSSRAPPTTATTVLSTTTQSPEASTFDLEEVPTIHKVSFDPLVEWSIPDKDDDEEFPFVLVPPQHVHQDTIHRNTTWNAQASPRRKDKDTHERLLQDVTHDLTQRFSKAVLLSSPQRKKPAFRLKRRGSFTNNPFLVQHDAIQHEVMDESAIPNETFVSDNTVLSTPVSQGLSRCCLAPPTCPLRRANIMDCGKPIAKLLLPCF